MTSHYKVLSQPREQNLETQIRKFDDLKKFKQSRAVVLRLKTIADLILGRYVGLEDAYKAYARNVRLASGESNVRKPYNFQRFKAAFCQSQFDKIQPKNEQDGWMTKELVRHTLALTDLSERNIDEVVTYLDKDWFSKYNPVNYKSPGSSASGK